MGESGGPAHNQAKNVDCRPNCGACCIAPSITSLGKPAGVACDHLRCAIFGQSGRPACCAGLQPSAEMCGASREEALRWLADLEARTAPDRRSGAQLVQPLPKVVGARREA
jgi:hypothetical protein